MDTPLALEMEHLSPLGPHWDERGGGGGVHSTGTVIVGELWKQSISLCWHSVMGTWRGDSFTRDPEGYEQEGTGDRHLFHRGPAGEPGRRFIYQRL